MTYSDCVRYLYSLGNEVQTARLGLERITRLLGGLGDPHRRGRFIHVAGTNGKGSTCAMIEAGLRAAGFSTGLFTSPHLTEPVERIRVNGDPISQQRFLRAFDSVHAAVERLRFDFHPTYFEMLTAMGFLVFAQESVNIAVIEVGLGGRLDATNVITPELSVITPIDLDHQQFLGNSIGSIAAEKAGILKPGVPAISAPQMPEAQAVLRSHAQGPLRFTTEYAIEGLTIDARGSRFCIDARAVICPLAGEHQVENARTACLALREFGVAPDGIARTEWPGRLERVSLNPEVILDGAHNPAGARAVAAYLRRFYADRRIWLVYGAVRDKDVSAMTSVLFPLAHRIILTAPDNTRAMPPEAIDAPGALIAGGIREALHAVRDAGRDDVALITGSLYLVGEARPLLVQ
jgi:dihydrofolate synthase/folylpolyglutamate synthase